MIQAIIPILFAMMCDSTRCEPLGHTTPLFEQTELSVCLENEEDSKTYLKHVALYVPPVNSLSFFPGTSMEEDKFKEFSPEFILNWKYRTEGNQGGSESSAAAYFVKDAETEHYDIYQVEWLDDCWSIEQVPGIDEDNPPYQVPRPISFEPVCGEYRHVGRSDNGQLLAVKVWKYVQKEREKRKRAKKTEASTRKIERRKTKK
ncbi:hypothetical protein [Bacteroides heparinolyticus]|uniref:hypothetical protein n=1 Tax=Prevotella heparinolytica TaxID=28113 RepID=UPI00359FB37F